MSVAQFAAKTDQGPGLVWTHNVRRSADGRARESPTGANCLAVIF